MRGNNFRSFNGEGEVLKWLEFGGAALIFLGSNHPNRICLSSRLPEIRRGWRGKMAVAVVSKQGSSVARVSLVSPHEDEGKIESVATFKWDTIVNARLRE